MSHFVSDIGYTLIVQPVQQTNQKGAEDMEFVELKGQFPENNKIYCMLNLQRSQIEFKLFTEHSLSNFWSSMPLPMLMPSSLPNSFVQSYPPFVAFHTLQGLSGAVPLEVLETGTQPRGLPFK